MCKSARRWVPPAVKKCGGNDAEQLQSNAIITAHPRGVGPFAFSAFRLLFGPFRVSESQRLRRLGLWLYFRRSTRGSPLPGGREKSEISDRVRVSEFRVSDFRLGSESFGHHVTPTRAYSRVTA
ncbi:hypothetical protein H6P81_008472 [Aristolochia fimbriata]|uniref:Uncharacterized protein n=1 Tax=Aristolochia fimbriata TaxID=158543 RepID=A0AAV7EI49_ARIFI|nr:hypothetical protein H6P81_008472 [Aristolochia fimbriata]